MRIGVDIDDVLYPWYEYAHEECKASGLIPRDQALPTSWSVWDDYGCTKDEWINALEHSESSGALYMRRPAEQVVEDLEALRDAGHTAHLVTARGAVFNGPLVKMHTTAWLMDWKIPHDTLTFAHDKTILNADIFIDDSPRNYTALWENDQTCYLKTATWNAHLEVPDIFRVVDFSDFTRRILAMGMP